jgi:hypothetical protein
MTGAFSGNESAAQIDPAPGSDSDDWKPATDDSSWVPPDIDVNQPSIARLYDLALGGKIHFAADRAVYDRLIKIFPEYPDWARANRNFMVRAVQFMARSGIRQFIDLGTGLPTEPNVHQVARAIRPDASVAYVDNDPIVIAHSRALLSRQPGIVTARHDIREPSAVFDDPAIREVIDFNEPVGLLLVAVLHFVRVAVAPEILARYRQALTAGSMVGISAICLDPSGERATSGLDESDAIGEQLSARMVLRTTTEIEGLFDGLDVVEPGVVDVTSWRADNPHPNFLFGLAGVGRVL